MHGSAPTRVFLVGFPRSGTTLLQSLVAAHPDVFSLPETFFFTRLMGLQRRDRWIGRVSPEAPAALGELAELGVALVEPPPRRRLRVGAARGFTRSFVAALDAAATAEGATCWIEKTPIHLHRIRAIERYVPDARVVHMVRAGVPAIASLYTVTQENPDRWDGARSPEECLRRWRTDLRLTRACVGRPGHVFVSYERLVADTPGTLARLCARLDLRCDEELVDSMVSRRDETSRRLVRDEPWKAGVAAQITDRNAARTDVFTEAERTRVEQAVAADEPLLRTIPFL